MFLAGQSATFVGDTLKYYQETILSERPYTLESFYYIKPFVEKNIPIYKDFMLDSGAFTYLNGKGSSVDWNAYVDRYGEFVKSHKIKKFLELDIDPIVGYEKVLKLRDRLEQRAECQCVPVWHVKRGINAFKEDIKQYPYICIGGIVTKEIKPAGYKAFPSLVSMAHERDCKVHGLGFTRLKDLKNSHFDSVDSTSWSMSVRSGFVYKYKDGEMLKFRGNGRLVDYKKEICSSFSEWIKMQKYIEQNFNGGRKHHEKNQFKFNCNKLYLYHIFAHCKYCFV